MFDIPISGIYLVSEALERNDGKIIITRKVVLIYEQAIGGRSKLKSTTNISKQIIVAFV